MERVLLGDVARLDIDRVAVEADGLYPIAGVFNNGSGLFDREAIRGTETNYPALHRLRTGQLVMRKLTAFEGAITCVTPEFDGYFVSTEFPTYTLDELRLEPAYMSLICRWPPFWQQMWLVSTGTVQRRKRVNPDALLSLFIPLPPIEEQRRVVELVGSFDAVYDALGQTAAAAKGVADAIRSSKFEDPSVEAVSLREICGPNGIQIGPFGSQLHAHDYVEDGIPTVMPKDIVDGQIKESAVARVSSDDWQRLSKHHLQLGDIVLPRRGDLTKRAIVGEREIGWLCGTGSIRVRVAGIEPAVAFEALSTAEAERWLLDHAVGITMPNLNTEIVGRLPVRVPPDAAVAIETIRAASTYSRRCDEARTALRVARESLIAELLSEERASQRTNRTLARQAP